jgi:heme/copper-type cytochrome/quinol oxidase subunit 1
MQTLEIVRLELLHFGIGLQPFAYVGLMLGTLLHWSEGAKGRIRGWQTINGVVWIGGVVMSVVQVVGLSKEGINGRKGSKYPISDQVIDVAVMAGVYAVVASLELVLGFWRTLRSARGQRENTPQSGMSSVIETAEFVGKYPPTL